MNSTRGALVQPIPRRNFLKAAASALAAGAMSRPLAARATVRLEPLPPGIKLSLQISGAATDEDLQFTQQLGVEYVSLPSGGD
ncbi:MAG: hypothetical protein FJ387_20065 [Verrucomicrobia bacterium]|nr:hypothetical protein [Verrucomicrobiota bacterium]